MISNKSLRKSPAYMNYYRLIREKIRLNAYQNYKRRKKGEVTITFLVFKDGSIKGLQLDSNSASNRRLRKIALKKKTENKQS